MIEGKERAYLSIKVQARVRKRGIEKIGPWEYKVNVISPPSKGKANREVVQILASYFGLPPSQVKIIKGKKSPRKKVLIEAQERAVSGHERHKKSDSG